MQTNLLLMSTCGSIDRKVRDFVWGNTNNSRKIHLLSCYRICCPTLQGGLGLRSAREVNLAFIMKVSWGICTHNDDLWAQLLKSKCMVHSQCSQTLKVALIGGEGFSQLELCWVEDHMEAWNGLKARFWLDPWLPDWGILQGQALKELTNDELNKRCNDFINEDGSRNFVSQMDWLPPETMNHIMAVSSFECWGWGCRPGTWLQMVISLFNLLMPLSDPVLDGDTRLFKVVWKWKGPQRKNLL